MRKAINPFFRQEVIAQHLPRQQISKQNEHYSRNGFPVGYFDLFRKTCSDSINCGTKTSHQVSLRLRDLEKNLSSNFLVLSEKLVFVEYLLLASVHTPHQVSLILQDSEKYGSSSFLSDKLVLVLHFPLVPVQTVDEVSTIHNCSSSRSLCRIVN